MWGGHISPKQSLLLFEWWGIFVHNHIPTPKVATVLGGLGILAFVKPVWLSLLLGRRFSAIEVKDWTVIIESHSCSNSLWEKKQMEIHLLFYFELFMGFFSCLLHSLMTGKCCVCGAKRLQVNCQRAAWDILSFIYSFIHPRNFYRYAMTVTLTTCAMLCA